MPELAETFGSITAQRRRAQRRTVGVLAAAQLLSGVGNGATLAVGSLLAVQFAGSDAWAGSVTTTLTLSAAMTALPLSGIAARHGRRAALVGGLAAASAGAALVVLATIESSLVVLLAGAVLLGVGSAVNLQSRFAAVDLADSARRGRDLSLVVWSITVGAVAGPNLIRPGAALGTALGLPGTAGPFVISVAGMALAAALLLVGLRPDPLRESQRLAALDVSARLGSAAADDGALPPESVPPGRGWASLRAGARAIRSSSGATLAVANVVVAQAVMVSVMAMTPLHLSHLAMAHSTGGADRASVDAFAIIGFTISLHIAGMFALSPVMGWLADRWGRRRTLALGQSLLVAAVAVAGLGAGDPVLVTAGLVLLGLGWSASTISGSALLAESVHGASRVLAQGVSDTAMGLAGALGGGTAGVVMAGLGYGGLAAIASVLSGCVLAAVALTRPRSLAAA
ncbi:MFS transporter [Sinomonas sp. ASV322]|uniref:MFS transporter n=1 Tax=Sinomonas sp. ASV322 TaxID=3041920 RepID=UPI0027DB8739|nr:MFS transporter [Sinomonas sp. ASV322]MDQ4500946.1 MFS transporter [Sinomonas sp. ASV322]